MLLSRDLTDGMIPLISPHILQKTITSLKVTLSKEIVTLSCHVFSIPCLGVLHQADEQEFKAESISLSLHEASTP